MNLYLHPIILFDRGLLSSTFARAFVGLAYVFLFWFNFRYPPPVSVERSAPNPDYLLELKLKENASPNLPLATATKVKFVTQTLTDETLNFASQWDACGGDPGLESIVLEQWITITPGAAMEKAKETHLDLLSWELLGEQEGADVWTKNKLLKWRQSEALLAGIARSAPHFVLQLIQQNQKLAEGKIWSGLLVGLARSDVEKALNFEVAIPERSYWGQGGRSFEYYRRLAEWARESPEAAFTWVSQNKDLHWHTSFLTRQIARTEPRLVQDAIDQLPTGATKKSFKDGLADSQKTFGTNDYNPRENGENRNPAQLISAIKVATDSFSDEWPDLLKGARFNDLTEARKNLIRAIITERWIDYNAMGYAKEFDLHDPACIARWLELDRQGVFRKLESLITRKDLGAHKFFEVILEIEGKNDIKEAFRLFAKVPEFHRWQEAYYYSDLLRKLAAHDREALLAATTFDEDWKDKAQAATISIWREKDLPWCLAKCLEWKRPSLITELDSSEFQRMPLIEHFDTLPQWLRTRILEETDHYLDLDLEWLLKPPPTKMDDESLAKLRMKQVAERYWYSSAEFETAAEVIKKCHFFDADLRSKIAERVVASHDLRELERAAHWLAKIPDEFSQMARICLASRREQIASESSTDPFQSSIVKALELTSNNRNFLEQRDRPFSEYEDVFTRIRRLPIEVCVELIKESAFQDLMIGIKKALLENAVKPEANRNDYTLGVPAQQMIIEWAKDEPVLAAKWAFALPQGSIRDTCLKDACYSWNTWDREEVRNWVQALPASDQKVISLR